MMRLVRDRIIDEQNRLGRAAHPLSGGLPWPSLAVALFLLVPSLGCMQEDGNSASIPIVELTDANFRQEVTGAKQPVLVEFWAPWCEPCLEMVPDMEKVAKDFNGRIGVARIRIDENPSTASTYNVNAPPVVIVFREGEVFKRRHGRQSAEELAALLREALDNEDSK
jgi:thioredoxin 1